MTQGAAFLQQIAHRLDRRCGPRRPDAPDDLTTVPPAALSAGVERMRVDLGLEQDRSRRFALWTLMYMLGAAPDLDVAFKDPADRDAARNLMEMSERLAEDD